MIVIVAIRNIQTQGNRIKFGSRTTRGYENLFENSFLNRKGAALGTTKDAKNQGIRLTTETQRSQRILEKRADV
jgi:hypothetical protein